MTEQTFQEQIFHHCYDCGWGEKGVYTSNLTFAQAFDLIASRTSVENATRFLVEQDGYFPFGISDYMISEECFEEDQWQGSEDY